MVRRQPDIKKLITEKPNKIEWAMVCIATFLIFTTMYYTDNRAIFGAAFSLNEELIEGKSVSLLGSMVHPYGILHQWICELWVAPINILHHLFGLSFENPFSFLWCKLCITLFFALCLKEMAGIASVIGISEKNNAWITFYIVSGILVALPVFHIAQTDCLYLLFMLKGFRALLEKKTIRFLLLFAVANSFKMISLFMFIPLILLTEKRICYVLRNVIIGCSIIPIQRIWYRIVGVMNGIIFASKSTEAMDAAIQGVETQAEGIGGFLGKIAKNILYLKFPAIEQEYTASLLVFVFVAFCIWCYVQDGYDSDGCKYIYKCLYISVISMAIFFVTSTSGVYWIAIMYPFLYLFIYTEKQRIRTNLLLEKVFTLAIFLVYVMSKYWVYGGAQTFEGLFLTKWGIVPSDHYLMGKPNIAGYLAKIGMEELMPIVTAICLASIIGFAWTNYPGHKYDEKLSDEYIVKLQHGFAFFNICILFGWYFINVLLISRY